MVITENSRVEDLGAGIVVTSERRRFDIFAARLDGIFRIIEPNTKVIDLHGADLSAIWIIGEDSGRTGDSVRRRQSCKRKVEGTFAKTADERACTLAIIVGWNVAVIPGKPKWRVRDLDIEDDEICVRRQAPDSNL